MDPRWAAFPLFLCCQWREESDKPLMGNRLTRCGFELRRQQLSLSPPFVPLTSTALRKSSCVSCTETTLWTLADKTIWLCWADESYLRLGSFSERETIVLCQLCLSCCNQLNLGSTCHVNNFFRLEHNHLSSQGDCPVWKCPVWFENSHIISDKLTVKSALLWATTGC